jgi:hypothetical protein
VKNKLSLFILAGAVLAIAAGVSYAAIPSSTGTISACKDTKGALKVIDAEAGQTCGANQQLLTWNQQGPPGPAGSVRAFAAIDWSGSVDAGNLTSANVVKAGTGTYCFGGLGFTPQVALVTLGSQSTIAGTPDVRVRLDGNESCPVGFRQVRVSLYNPQTGTFDDEDFFILSN